MKILILTVGKLKDKRVSSLAGEYLARVRPGLVSAESVPDGGRAPEECVELEGREILQKLRPRDRLILLGEDGNTYGSEAFAAMLSREMETAPGRIVMAIGGPWGVSAAVRARADLILSLSPMTFPHELCFLFLAEQLYRAFSILKGAKYHH
ncbi:MAG: 23S rRNA (pseudouridine(1915)-N(3))-methyltransferase RlmH [Synergistaceae bacterium]|nr:23S rRNA (pseudouridine(1915)-N(3))-methyltransferase RlmH [Synergistaceae bacterium]